MLLSCRAAIASLLIYHLMFAKKLVKPCPMCTMWIDGADGVVQHIAQNIVVDRNRVAS
jgi:predicted dithiol-disulfide oxidoreductase (DUF899 family)